MNEIKQIQTISAFHELAGLPKPEHPLISVVDYGVLYRHQKSMRFVHNYYSIALKKDVVGKFRYGQKDYDFDEGLMTFFAPNQVLKVDVSDENTDKVPSGFILNIHHDFLHNTVLSEKIKHYNFFGYEVNEALFLSEKEEKIILEIMHQIQHEYLGNMDEFSKNIIISQIELLLNYAERFYKRQFLTREKSNHEILTRFETALATSFTLENIEQNGLPTVQSLARQLNLSADYLSQVLKILTGQSTRQHIQKELIETAKIKLSTTTQSVSEIAYELGFEHPQSFSKLFKKQTLQTPLEFRASFN